jgi:gliding motility-associated protein GldC
MLMQDNQVVHTSEIKINVGLNASKMPIKIDWSASDMAEQGVQDCKAMSIALFDENHRDTLRIDLWTQDMQVIEMDRFMYNILKSLGDTYLRATQNKALAEDMARFAQYFGEKTEIIAP